MTMSEATTAIMPGLGQLTGHTRSHHLDAPEIDTLAKALAHGRDNRLLGKLAAFRLLHTYQHLVRRTELLHLHVAEIQRSELGTDAGDVGGRLMRLELEDRAALEVDAEVEADREEQRDGGQKHDRRERERQHAQPHEADVRRLGEKSEKHFVFPGVRSSGGSGASSAPTARPEAATR